MSDPLVHLHPCKICLTPTRDPNRICTECREQARLRQKEEDKL